MLSRLQRHSLPPWVMVAAIATGTFITALDQTVVVTALPAVMVDLKIQLARLEAVIWVVTAYLLGYTVAMPLLGRLADVYGYTRIYQCSLLVFCVGTTLVALSGEWDWLNGQVDPLDQIVIARVVQAIGGGGTVPISLAIAAALVSPEKRGLALGIVAGAAEAGSMLGPAYGGAIIEIWSWRGIFWLNVPQAAVIAAALLFLPNQRFADARMDYRGAIVLTVRPGAALPGGSPRGSVPAVVLDTLLVAGGLSAQHRGLGVVAAANGAAAAVRRLVPGLGFRDGQHRPATGGDCPHRRHGRHGDYGQHGDGRAGAPG